MLLVSGTRLTGAGRSTNEPWPPGGAVSLVIYCQLLLVGAESPTDASRLPPRRRTSVCCSGAAGNKRPLTATCSFPVG